MGPIEIPLAMQGLDEAEIELVCNVFRSGNHTMGAQVQEFELAFAKKMKVKHAVMVNSGSSANLLALEAITRGLANKVNQKKGLVAVPAILWPTTIWPIIQLGYEALLIDTLPNSLEIDLEQLISAKEKFGEELVGAFIIHPLGKSVSLKKIQHIKDEYGIFVIEDNCESLGAGEDQMFAGTVGDFGTFSFYYSHHMTTVEGGMVVTNSDTHADDLRSMRAHGWTRNRSDKVQFEKDRDSLEQDFNFVTSGFNFRPMEFQGALGLSQLKKLNTFIERRIDIADHISKNIPGSYIEIIESSNISNFLKSTHNHNPVNHSWMALPCRLKNSRIELAEVHFKLNQAGIHTRPLLAGNFSKQLAGRDKSIHSHGNLQNSELTYETSFMLGNHHGFSEEQVNKIIEELRKFQ